MQCEQLADHLAASDGGHLDDAAAQAHVESCLRCQAELAQYRKLLKALRTLRTEVLTPAPGLVTDILTHLEERGERSAMRSAIRGRRAAYLGGIAVAATAGGAAALVVFSRRKLRAAS
jgi:anti-sigma factor RsiW